MSRAKQTRRSVSIKGETYANLKRHCDSVGQSMSGYVEELLAAHVPRRAPLGRFGRTLSSSRLASQRASANIIRQSVRKPLVGDIVLINPHGLPALVLTVTSRDLLLFVFHPSGRTFVKNVDFEGFSWPA